MDAHADQPISRDVRLRQGETLKLPNDGLTLQEISCDDIARLALAMHDHSYFFSLRRGISIRFSRDLNGSGTQGLFINKRDETNLPYLIQVFFDCTYEKDGDFLYEADLIVDRGKDYEPTVNMGKHRFVAKSATMRIDWNSDETGQWRSDIDRLSRSPETLTGWIEDDVEMLVRCGSKFFCREPAILTKNDLKRHIAAGLNLEDLKARLKCSRCGKRGAGIMVF